MNPDIQTYNNNLSTDHKAICDTLAQEIMQGLSGAENKIWHGHPVWFLDGNPIVGYSPRADGSINLMFWSGQSFGEPTFKPEGSFKAAEIRYTSVDQIDTEALSRWLQKSEQIQWDYKNLVKHKGDLLRLK